MNNQTQLVPVFAGTINNQSIQLVDARLLHEFLDIGKRFASWITDRIKQYDFIENQEFILVSQNGEIKKGKGGDRRSVNYHLTLDMAKELSMVERNDKGREARRYFIDCEKQLQQQSDHLKPITGTISLEELEARQKYHRDALNALENVPVTLTAEQYQTLKKMVESERIQQVFCAVFGNQNDTENHHTRWTETEKQTLNTYRAQGLSYKNIAIKMGRTHQAVKSAAAKYSLGA